MVVILFLSVLVPPWIVRLARAAVPPITPLTPVEPDVVRVKPWSPLTVPTEMAPPPVEDRVALPVRVRALPKLCAAVVVTLPLSVVLPLALIASDLKGVLPPTTPPSVIAPVVVTDSASPPLTLWREMLPPPLEVRVAPPVKVSASP